MAIITITLNDAEQQTFGQLLDVALRGAGINAIDSVNHFRGKISTAMALASRPAPTPVKSSPEPSKPAPAIKRDKVQTK